MTLVLKLANYDLWIKYCDRAIFDHLLSFEISKLIKYKIFHFVFHFNATENGLHRINISVHFKFSIMFSAKPLIYSVYVIVKCLFPGNSSNSISKEPR